MMRRPLSAPGRLVLAWAGLAAAAACGGDVPDVEPARPAPAPPGYEQGIAAWRADKDELFRRSADSPLPAPVKMSFGGLDYFPVDPSLRFVGKLAVHPTPQQLIMVGTEGERRPAERWALFRFLHDGEVLSLNVYRLTGERDRGSVFLPFTDETTGRETYPAGRYVDPEIGPDGSVLVDFNTAYFPFCAYGKAYDCPITPAENRLDVPIRAGERGWRDGWLAEGRARPAAARGEAGGEGAGTVGGSGSGM